MGLLRLSASSPESPVRRGRWKAGGTKGLDKLGIPKREGVLAGGEELGLLKKGEKNKENKSSLYGRQVTFVLMSHLRAVTVYNSS